LTAATATSSTVNTITSFTYDDIGNITSKSDVGTYAYNASGANSVRPHAVASITGSVYGVTNPAYTYDANGNMTAGAGRTVTWTSFNMPSQMTGCPNGGSTCSTVGFWYNSDHERIKELQADQSVVITLSPRYDIGLHFEKKYIAANGTLTGAVEYEHYLYAGSGQMFGNYVVTTQTDGVTVASAVTKYFIKDHLGSVVAVLDGTGTVLERMSYDVFGKRRNPDGSAATIVDADMYHGFTGQEMLDAVGLIHLNGRVYDPITGRFTSADPTVQAPLNMQGFNRYTYGWNDPLAGIDPSGYSWLGDEWGKLKNGVHEHVGQGLLGGMWTTYRKQLNNFLLNPAWGPAKINNWIFAQGSGRFYNSLLNPLWGPTEVTNWASNHDPAHYLNSFSNNYEYYTGHWWYDLTGTPWYESRDQYVKPIVAMVIAYYTGVYVEGETGSYVAAGAASGAAGAGSLEAMNGGNGSQVLTAAFYGAVSGAITGGMQGGANFYLGNSELISGRYGSLSTETLVKRLSGALNTNLNNKLQACWQQNNCAVF